MIKPRVARQLLHDGGRGKWVAFNEYAQAFITEDFQAAVRFALKPHTPGTVLGGRPSPCGAFNHFALESTMDGCPYCKDQRAMKEAVSRMSDPEYLMRYFSDSSAATRKVGEPVAVRIPAR